MLSEIDRPAEAVSRYEHGLKLRRWDAGTAAAGYNNLAVLLRDSGRAAEAEAAFAAAKRASPRNAPADAGDHGGDAAAGGALSFGALIERANDLYAASASAEAAHWYRRAMPLRDARADASAYVGLGAALHASGRVSEALGVLRAGAEVNPSFPSLQFNLATVSSDAEDFAGAARAWRRVLSGGGAPAAAHRAAGAVFEKVRRYSEAHAAYAASARIEPSNWQAHYTSAHALLHSALRGRRQRSGAAAEQPSDAEEVADALFARRASEALAAMRPLHRLPISLRMRSDNEAVPPWSRDGGRGLGDAPPPLGAAALEAAQAAHAAEAAAVRRRPRGLILYKLGTQEKELRNLRLSMALLERFSNRARCVP